MDEPINNIELRLPITVSAGVKRKDYGYVKGKLTLSHDTLSFRTANFFPNEDFTLPLRKIIKVEKIDEQPMYPYYSRSWPYSTVPVSITVYIKLHLGLHGIKQERVLAVHDAGKGILAFLRRY